MDLFKLLSRKIILIWSFVMVFLHHTYDPFGGLKQHLGREKRWLYFVGLSVYMVVYPPILDGF
jgi:hypothetical protein